MNERIKVLMLEAGYAAPEIAGRGQKLAELIVRECADIAQQHNKSPVAAPLAIGYVIREHFGVEE
jgi:hypothetical protein